MDDFKLEITSVWSFPQRGKWSTHNSKYRGNFAPQVAKNVILRYTKEKDLVIDPMCGSGTTLIECKILGRSAIGIDINPEVIKIAENNLHFNGKGQITLKVGDTRNLDFINDNSVDLILTHPPYLNIIKYSDGKIENDLSNISGLKKFLAEFAPAIKEYYRILKPNKYCAILIGDTRRSRHYVPLSFHIMNEFLKVGFLLKEDIIKIQHNCTSTPYWEKQVKKYNFFLIMHEHLFIFRKPIDENDYKKYKNTSGII